MTYDGLNYKLQILTLPKIWFSLVILISFYLIFQLWSLFSSDIPLMFVNNKCGGQLFIKYCWNCMDRAYGLMAQSEDANRFEDDQPR